MLVLQYFFWFYCKNKWTNPGNSAVACAPASLGRDARILEAGALRMTDLYTVDLFPQTGHVEAVARFVR